MMAKAVACEPSINYEHYAPTLIIRDTLGVPLERFEELRRENLLLYWYEAQWIQVAVIVSGLAALVITVWRWHHFPSRTPEILRTIPRLLISLLIGFFSWVGLAWGLSALSNLLPMNLSVGYWNLITPLTLVGAAGTFVWEWQILGGWEPEMTVFRFIYSVGGGFITFSMLNFLLVGSLLILGFVD